MKGMNRKQAVKYAMNSMSMEGFKYTEKEKILWEKVAAGELPLSTVDKVADAFDQAMRSRFPEKYATEDEADA